MAKISVDINKIYILCPSYSKSGGPELLHQLCFNLNRNNIECKMVYYNIKTSEHLNPEFRKYDTTEIPIDDIIDDRHSLVIAPESYFIILKRFHHCYKSIWWTSVDNYTRWGVPSLRIKNYGICNFLRHPLESYISNKVIQKVDYHFCQSYYSKEYLINKGIEKNKLYMLSDYISDEYFEEDYDIDEKEDWVAYFPSKGFDVTSKLIEFAPDIKWKPIQNMTTSQVRGLLQKCKVYIDFGNFPGKDRIPREAAISGCCIITGTKGASYYYQDVPIDSKYKFDNPLQNKVQIIDRIRECISNYNTLINDFSDYREIIASEKDMFEKEVKKIFV